MKKYLFGALAVLASPVAVFAEDPAAPAVTVPDLVTVTDIQSDLVTAIQPWISAGLGVGIAVFCLYLGWRLIKKFTR